MKLAGLKSAAPPSGPAATSDNPMVAARAGAEAATAYIAEQAKKGITVSVADAVNHVMKEG